MPFLYRWPELQPPAAKVRVKAALFGGCLMDFVYPEQGEAFISLVSGRGVKLDYPLEQTCCGLPAQMAGDERTARAVARRNLAALDPADFDFVVTLCASCGSHIKGNYPALLADSPGLGVKARQLADKMIDFSSFMVDVLGVAPAEGASGPKTAYHAPCHLCRGMKVTQAPRTLMRAAGLDYTPLENEEVCCGFGGSYSMEFPEVSARILQEKLDQVEASGAGLLVTDCPGCVLQLRGGLDKRHSKVRVLHLAQAAARKLK